MCSPCDLDFQTQEIETLREITSGLSAHINSGAGGVFRQTSTYQSSVSGAGSGEGSGSRGSARDGSELKKATQVSIEHVMWEIQNVVLV